MKQCSKCKKDKSVEDFSFKIKAIGLRHLQCKECTRLLIKNHYNKNREYYLIKSQKRNEYLRLRVNTYLRDFLFKHPCVDCGEKDITVLEFDHTGKLPKFKAVSGMVRFQYSLEKIKEEIEKCEVRCANCHKRKTAKDFRWFKMMPL
jgi:hypothetical protein